MAGHSSFVNRRSFLRAAGAGTLCLVSAPYVRAGGAQKPPESRERILGEADERIQKHRKGTASLRLMGPGGQALPPGYSTPQHLRAVLANDIAKWQKVVRAIGLENSQ